MGNIAGGFETTAFPAINMENYIDYLTKTYNGPVRVPEPQNRYDIGERICAGYAQLNFKNEPNPGQIGSALPHPQQPRTTTAAIKYKTAHYAERPDGDSESANP